MRLILDRSFKSGLDLYAPDPKPPAHDSAMPGELELPRSWVKLHLNQGANVLTQDQVALVKKHVEAGGGLILSQASDSTLVLTNNLDREGRKLLKPTAAKSTAKFANDSRSIIERALNSRITVSIN